MKKNILKLGAFILALSMTASAIPSFAADNDYATREYVVSEFVQSVGRNNLNGSEYILSTFADKDDISDEYVSDMEKAVTNGIVRGYEDKTLQPKENITRLEALVMLARSIPKDKTDDTENTAEPVKFTDVPEWAEEDIDTLTKAGLVKGYGDGRLGSEDNITTEQVKLLTDRSDELLNDMTPGQSFYGYVNSKAFRNAELDTEPVIDFIHGSVKIPNNSWSYMSDAQDDTNDKIMDTLEKLMDGELEYEDGSVEQRIHDMLECIADSDNYHAEDSRQFESYCRSIMNAKDISSLLQTVTDIYNETGVNPLFNVNANLDPDTHAVIPQIDILDIGEGGALAFYSKNNTRANKERYYKLISSYLSDLSINVSDSDIKKAVSLQIETAKNENYISAYEMMLGMRGALDETYSGEQCAADIEKIKSEHKDMLDEDGEAIATEEVVKSIDEADKLFDNVKISELLQSYGFENVDEVMLVDEALDNGAKKLFTESNLSALKINVVLSLGELFQCAGENEDVKTDYDNLLRFETSLYSLTDSDDFYDILNSTFLALSGVSDDSDEGDDDILSNTNIQTLSSVLPNDLGLLYCNYYYDDEDSEVIGDMLIDLAEEYVKEFENCSWLSEPTKQAAIDKIGNMIAVIGYPDNYDFPTITSMSQGGTYFKNLINISKNDKDTMLREINDQEFLRTEMVGMTPEIFNACYIPILNTINVPAGFIKLPMYDKDASYASNLGSIGMALGHEIGHAFDATGAKYDLNGCEKNWWTDEDLEKFEEKKQEFIEYYKNFEVIDDVTQDPEITITENMADIAGIECVMNILKDDEEAQKEALLAFAKVWAKLGTEEILTDNTYLTNEHSANQVRVNACVASLDCFYDLFNITEDDPMYVAPEDRLKLWSE
jgi:putative endopeptidase